MIYYQIIIYLLKTPTEHNNIPATTKLKGYEQCKRKHGNTGLNIPSY